MKTIEKLTTLAKKPFDLVEGLNTDRIQAMTLEIGSFRLLYGTERVTEDVIEALCKLAEELKVVEKMRQMQEGEVINNSEKRSVLHTALRDFFAEPIETPLAKKAAALALAECEKLEAFLLKTHAFKDLVVIGIGGSELGPACLYQTIPHHRTVHFVGNVDPDEIFSLLRRLDLKHTLVAVISKTGGTLETATNDAIARTIFQEAKLPVRDHFIAVTEPGSPMDDEKRFLERFYFWRYIGGRYSVLGMPGAIVAGFAAGFATYWEIVEGANAMDKVALQTDPKKNLPLFLALLSIWNNNFLGCRTTAIIPYSRALSRLPAHLQQVTMESNGKRVDRNGNPVTVETSPVIWGEPGTNAQHSFFQMLHQGTSIVPVQMIGFSESQLGEDQVINGTTSQEKLLANLFAQALAFTKGQKNQGFPGNRPVRVLLAKKLTPYVVGSLLALFEHQVAFEGFIWNLNSFDQEGVQLGKKIADDFLHQFEGKGEFPLGEAFLKQLWH